MGNRANQIFARIGGVNGHWKYIPGRLRQIAVGSKRIFGIDRYHRIWTRVGVKGGWKLIPGRLTYVATNSHNQLTGTNRYGSIYFGIANKAQAKKLKKRIMKAKVVKRKMKKVS